MSQVWVTRAGQSAESQEFALKNGCAVFGFRKMGDLSLLDSYEKSKKKYEEVYPGAKPVRVGLDAWQCLRFAHKIQEGDYVVMPRKKVDESGRLHSVNCSAVGIVRGGYRYDESATEFCKNQRKVEWLKEEFPNAEIPGGFSLGGRATVFLMKYTKITELVAALEGSTTAVSTDVVDPDETDLEDIGGYIQKNFQGEKLCVLVKEILAAMGYDCELTPQSNDGGIDIVAYHNLVESFGVEVKNRAAYPGVATVRGFDSALKGRKGIFVSWGGFGGTENKLKKDYPHIRLWDGEEVVRLVQKHYHNFSDEFKRDKLPLEQVWMVNLGDGSADDADE